VSAISVTAKAICKRLVLVSGWRSVAKLRTFFPYKSGSFIEVSAWFCLNERAYSNWNHKAFHPNCQNGLGVIIISPIAGSIFRPRSQTHISKRVFMNEISSSALLDIQLTLLCVCGVDSFLPELEHL